MAQTQMQFDFALEDVDVDWEHVARVLAGQLARSTDFEEGVQRLEREASYKMRRAWANPDDVGESINWESPYAAAMLLREADEEAPGLRDQRDTERMLGELRRAQVEEAAMEREDPVQWVLISPRQRQNVIERIVNTHGGRVHVEYWHETGWRRYKTDLRTVLSGTPLPTRAAEAISRRPGVFDDLPTEECLAEMKKLDGHATVSGLIRKPRLGARWRFPTTTRSCPTLRFAQGRLC